MGCQHKQVLAHLGDDTNENLSQLWRMVNLLMHLQNED